MGESINPDEYLYFTTRLLRARVLARAEDDDEVTLKQRREKDGEMGFAIMLMRW